MLDILSVIIGMSVTFVVVIVVHELGHYFAARAMGVRPSVCSLGFGKVLWSRLDARGTTWQIGAFPIGGFCRFVGDENAASLKTARTAEVIPGSLDAAPVAKRCLVVLAGPLANLGLSLLLFWFAQSFDETSGMSFGKAFEQLTAFLVMSSTGLAATVLGSGEFCALSGPMGIASVAGQALQLGPYVFVQFVAVISASVAIFNLLPIPGLDGGHLLSYMLESCTGRPLGEKGKRLLFILGVTVITHLALMATFSDLFCP